MRILGVDPGTATTGFGLIDVSGNKIKHVFHGCIKTKAKDELAIRLQTIHNDIEEIINEYKPDVFAIENIFMHENARTALLLGHARASAMIAAVNLNLKVFEYSPREVKQSVVGNGNASKEQIQYMVKMLLNLREIPKPNDAADGCAIAICHFNRIRFLKR